MKIRVTFGYVVTSDIYIYIYALAQDNKRLKEETGCILKQITLNHIWIAAYITNKDSHP